MYFTVKNAVRGLIQAQNNSILTFALDWVSWPADLIPPNFEGGLGIPGHEKDKVRVVALSRQQVALKPSWAVFSLHWPYINFAYRADLLSRQAEGTGQMLGSESWPGLSTSESWQFFAWISTYLLEGSESLLQFLVFFIFEGSLGSLFGLWRHDFLLRLLGWLAHLLILLVLHFVFLAHWVLIWKF